MGGGKTGGEQTATPPLPMSTSIPVGNQLDAAAQTFEEETDLESAVDKKKKGTRGLVIPLATTTPTTTSKTGVQL